MKEKIDNLSGVPETMLWPLYNRGSEQRRADRMVEDPMSLQLMENIDYDFAGNFGRFNAGHPLRSRVFDDIIAAWLERNPGGTVVSLGEGLDTQFWRIDNGKHNWISVDLPESIEVRERFLPQHERMKNIACSALDSAWLKQVPEDKPVFIVLAGVIMYFTEAEAKTLIAKIAGHFAESEIVFDMIPEWYSRKTLKGMSVTKSYTAPPMPWGLNYKNSSRLLEIHPALKMIRKFSFVDFFPERMRPFSYFRKIKWVKDNMAPWMVHLAVNNK